MTMRLFTAGVVVVWSMASGASAQNFIADPTFANSTTTTTTTTNTVDGEW